jgi:hypothetical protein
MTKAIEAVMVAAMAAGLSLVMLPEAAAQTMVPVAAGTRSEAPLVRVGQVKDDLFAGTEKFAKGASKVTEVNLDPTMMGMIPGRHGEDDLAHKMRYMVIHTYEYPKPGMYNEEDVEAYRKKLEDGTWHCAIHVKDKSGTTDICSRTAPDHEGNEMVILTAEPKELTFIHMSGNMSLEDLSRMSGRGSRRMPPAPAVPSAPGTPGAPAAPAAPAAPR